MTVTTTVQTQTTGIPGRYMLSGQGKHMVVDASAHTGGKEESFVAQELLVGSLSTCAQAIVHATGEREGIFPSKVVVETTSERDPEAVPPEYIEVRMHFEFSGISQGQAELLTTAFTSLCPIYYTVAQATRVQVTVRAL